MAVLPRKTWVAAATTAPLPPPTGQTPKATGKMVPRRAQTRTRQRAYRINTERKRNTIEHPPQPRRPSERDRGGIR